VELQEVEITLEMTLVVAVVQEVIVHQDLDQVHFKDVD
tara:strand:- start:593 stop:706 length:114 start_codon:yes stop_codon:yes gene_type:complete